MTRNRGFLILALLIAFVSPMLAAQEDAPSPLSYNLSFVPGLDGSINIRAGLDYSWLAWMSSGILFYTDNYVRTNNTAEDVSTLSSTGRTAMLTLLELNQDLVWQLFKFRLEWLDFSAALIGGYNYIAQEKYGYDPSESPVLFYLNESTATILKPLQRYKLGLDFGFLKIAGLFQSTIYWANEEVTTKLYTSIMTEEAVPVSKTYVGGDTLAGGDLELDLRYIKLLGNYEYYLHVMTNRTKSGTSQTETHTVGGALVLSFLKLTGGSPLIGLDWIRKIDFLVATRETITVDMLRLNFGIRY